MSQERVRAMRVIKTTACWIVVTAAVAAMPLKADEAADAAAVQELQQRIEAFNKEGKHGEMVALCRQVAADARLPIKFRYDTGRRGALLLRHQLSEPQASVDLLEELLQLELDAKQRGEVLRTILSTVAHHIKPRNFDAIEKWAELIANDHEIELNVRAMTVIELVSLMRTGNDTIKARPLPLALRYLAEEELEAGHAARLRQMLQHTYTALKQHEEAWGMAEATFKDSAAPAASQHAAALFLAQELLQADKFEESEALLRQALAIPKLNEAQVAQLLERIGQQAIWLEAPEKAFEVYQEGFNYFKTDAMTNQVIRLSSAALIETDRYEEAAALWLKRGNRVEAANAYGSTRSPFDAKARELRLEVLQDEQAAAAERVAVYPHFLTFSPADAPVAEKYRNLYVAADTNRAVRTFTDKILSNGRGTAYFSNSAATLRYYRWLQELAQPHPAVKAGIYAIHAHAALGQLDEALALTREVLAYEKVTEVERYGLRLIEQTLGIREELSQLKSVTGKLAAREAALAKELNISSENRVNGLELAGATVLHARLETAARAIAAVREALYTPEPKKRYTLRYSPTPISGIDAWNSLAKAPERDAMDRKYGGNLEFLVTDVATGDRGSGIGSDAATAAAKPPQFSALCDVDGIHLRFDAFDEQAAKVAAKLLGAGSYEGYIAPGANQPYICFLIDLQSGKTDFYNTTYDTQNHTRIRTEDTSMWRSEHRFNPDGFTTYLFLSWQAYSDKLPEAGDVWEFENVHWARGGSFSWNGLKSIHGRSSWGELTFEIQPE